jgi:hypothetical protein
MTAQAQSVHNVHIVHQATRSYPVDEGSPRAGCIEPVESFGASLTETSVPGYWKAADAIGHMSPSLSTIDKYLCCIRLCYRRPSEITLTSAPSPSRSRRPGPPYRRETKRSLVPTETGSGSQPYKPSSLSVFGSYNCLFFERRDGPRLDFCGPSRKFAA